MPGTRSFKTCLTALKPVSGQLVCKGQWGGAVGTVSTGGGAAMQTNLLGAGAKGHVCSVALPAAGEYSKQALVGAALWELWELWEL